MAVLNIMRLHRLYLLTFFLYVFGFALLFEFSSEILITSLQSLDKLEWKIMSYLIHIFSLFSVGFSQKTRSKRTPCLYSTLE